MEIPNHTDESPNGLSEPCRAVLMTLRSTWFVWRVRIPRISRILFMVLSWIWLALRGRKVDALVSLYLVVLKVMFVSEMRKWEREMVWCLSSPRHHSLASRFVSREWWTHYLPNACSAYSIRAVHITIRHAYLQIHAQYFTQAPHVMSGQQRIHVWFVKGRMRHSKEEE